MLPKNRRLNLKTEYTEVIASGKKFDEPVMSLIVAGGNGQARFGVVVGTRINKMANKRNRIRRLVNQALTQNLPLLTKPGRMLFLVRKDISTWSYDQVFNMVNLLLKKARQESP